MRRVPHAAALTAIGLVSLLFGGGAAGTGVGISGWRGDGSGVYTGAMPPVSWDAESKKNVLWSVTIGKSIHSSPVVVAGRVFVVCEPNVLTCLDAASGKTLWTKASGVGDLPQKVELVPVHPDVGNTTPTPVSDGASVFVEFANGIVARFDLDGNRKWITFVDEPCATGNGRSASPVLVAGKLVLSMGKMMALEAATGKVVWKSDKVPESYGTPLPVRIDESMVLIAPSGELVDAANGNVLAKTSADLTYASAIAAGGTVYFVDADSCALPLTPVKGAQKKKWQMDLEGEFFASPVYHKGLIYTVSNQGRLYVIDATRGTLVYDKQLDIASMGGGAGGTANLYASLAMANGRIYITNDKGQTVVIEPGEQYKEVARNALNTTVVGNLAFAGTRIYVRTPDSLICLGE
jgi:outer membrane protein assembly factor BamB